MASPISNNNNSNSVFTPQRANINKTLPSKVDESTYTMISETAKELAESNKLTDAKVQKFKDRQNQEAQAIEEYLALRKNIDRVSENNQAKRKN